MITLVKERRKTETACCCRTGKPYQAKESDRNTTTWSRGSVSLWMASLSSLQTFAADGMYGGTLSDVSVTGAIITSDKGRWSLCSSGGYLTSEQLVSTHEFRSEIFPSSTQLHAGSPTPACTHPISPGPPSSQTHPSKA